MKKNTTSIIILIIAIAYILFVFFTKIPLYKNWIDVTSFENQFNTNLVIYSNIWLEKNQATIQKDKKIYEITAWLSDYEISINKWWSQILFKSDDLYPNTSAFLVFKWWNFIQISPQSAINIDQNYNIEIIDWDIKYRPQNPTKFSFVWTKNWIICDEENLKIINNRYYDKLKSFIKQDMWILSLNPTILKISRFTLKFLSLFSNKYEKNLSNLQQYLDLFDINLDTNKNFNNQINNEWLNKNLRKNVKKWFNSIN